MGLLRLHAPLVARGPAAAIVLDPEQVQALGEGAKRFPVLVTVNGRTLRLAVTRMGGEYLVGFSRAARDEAGVRAGEAYELELALDVAPREVELPPALADALAADQAARDGFAALAPSHRKEYARWIAEAKREETRQRRVDEALARLRQGEPRQ